jgi:thiamine pyrophosphate-dependent acetolactate synthase large subunit-like protein
MSKIKAKQAFVQQLLADGVKYIFGNPGTLEESFLDALSDFPEMHYILGLQESVVLGMASGYARATKRPSIVQLHTMVGLGNAMGMLYEADRSHLPLVIYAGETWSEVDHLEGFFSDNLVEMAKPITKWAYRITHGSSLLQVLRKAYKVAMTPPQGPVFLAIPMDVFEEEVEPDIHPSTQVDWRISPGHEAVARIAQGLMEAENPMILFGDQIHLTDAYEELIKLAEQIGCPIYGADFSYQGRYSRDSLYMKTLNFSFGKYNLPITRQADVILVLGTPLSVEMFPYAGSYFQEGARVFQVDLNPWEIGKNFQADLGLMADPKETLIAVSQEVESRLSPEFQRKAGERKEHWLQQKQREWEEEQKTYDHLRPQRPMHPSHMMKIVVEMLPENALVYDESITSSPFLVHHIQSAKSGFYFNSRGRCLGAGWTGAVGAKLAFPDRPVLALSGDGASLYINQTLWTAAHYNLHIIFLVCNNRSYRILKLNILEYWAEEGIPLRRFPHHDLEKPYIQFDKIAEGFGVRAWQATDPDSLRAALQGALTNPGPHLIDVEISGDVSEDITTIMGKS